MSAGVPMPDPLRTQGQLMLDCSLRKFRDQTTFNIYVSFRGQTKVCVSVFGHMHTLIDFDFS